MTNILGLTQIKNSYEFFIDHGCPKAGDCNQICSNTDITNIDFNLILKVITDDGTSVPINNLWTLDSKSSGVNVVITWFGGNIESSATMCDVFKIFGPQGPAFPIYPPQKNGLLSGDLDYNAVINWQLSSPTYINFIPHWSWGVYAIKYTATLSSGSYNGYNIPKTSTVYGTVVLINAKILNITITQNSTNNILINAQDFWNTYGFLMLWKSAPIDLPGVYTETDIPKANWLFDDGEFKHPISNIAYGADGLPLHGTVKQTSNTIVYTPNASFTGSDQVIWSCQDNAGPGRLYTPPPDDNITVVWNISVIPLKPTCTDMSMTVAFNTSVNIDLSKSIPNWTNDDVLTITQPSNGTASNTGEQVLYKSNKNYYGKDSFQFTITNVSGVATCNCNLTINPISSCTNSAFTVVENSANNSFDLTNFVSYISGTLAISTKPSHGVATINGNVITYTPTQNYYGQDTLKYSITSTYGNCTCLCTITVKPLPPTCTISYFTVAENSSKNLLDLSKYIQGWIPSPSSYISLSAAPLNGSANPSNETMSYTPNANYYGTDTFLYTVTNSAGTSSNCLCNVSVVENKPTCTNLTSTVAANSSNNQIDVASHIQNLLSPITITNPLHGIGSISGKTIIVYTPSVNYTGTDLISFTSTNTVGSCTCNVGITITPPTAQCTNAPAFTVPENSYQNSLSLSKYITYWTQQSTLKITSLPSNGSANVSGESIIYTPKLTFYGTDSLQYTVTNETGTSTPCNCTINVPPPVPTCKKASTSVTENSSNNTIDLTGYIPLWISGSILKVSSNPPNGVIPLITGESVKYTPTTGYVGTDSFQYTVTNVSGTSTPCTCLIYVLPLPPTCSDSSISMVENTSQSISLKSYIQSWIQGSSNINLYVKPTHGTLTSFNGENVTYTPNANYYGKDSFQYTVTNVSGKSSPCTCNISISQPIPTCNTASETIVENSTNSFNLSLYIQNWTSKSSLNISVNPSYGTVSSNKTENVQYIPNTDYYGSDSFQYTVTNEYGTSSNCLCNITVLPLPPTCITMNETVNEGSSNNVFDLSKAIKNWASNSSLKIISGPTNGTSSVNGEKVTYIPKSSFYGSDLFQYTVTNPTGTSAKCTCNITVVQQYPPTCKQSLFKVGINSSNNSFDLTSYITSWTSDATIAVTSTVHGTTTAKGEGLIYTPNNGYSGTDAIEYSITNAFGTTSSCKCNITIINPPNCAVLTPSGSWTATFNENSSGNIINANPGNWTSDTTMTVISTNHGTTTVNGNQLLYTPNTNFSGFDTIQYSVTNEGGTSNCLCNLGIIPVNINQMIDMWASLYKMFAYGNNYPTDWSTTSPVLTTIDLSNYITWDKNTSISNYNVGNGTGKVSGSTITVTPPQLDVNGYMDNGVYKILASDSGYNILQWDVICQVTNTFGSTNYVNYLTINFTLDVTLLLVAPIAKDLTVYMIGGGADPQITRTTVYIYTNAVGNKDAYEGIVSPWVPSISTLQIVTGPTNGNVTIGYDTAANGGGYFAYTPNSGYTGNDSFQYTATNPVGTSSTATITVVCGSGN